MYTYINVYFIYISIDRRHLITLSLSKFDPQFLGKRLYSSKSQFIIKNDFMWHLILKINKQEHSFLS